MKHLYLTDPQMSLVIKLVTERAAEIDLCLELLRKLESETREDTPAETPTEVPEELARMGVTVEEHRTAMRPKCRHGKYFDETCGECEVAYPGVESGS